MAAVAEVREAACTDPVGTAVVLLGLLSETFLEHLEDLVDVLITVALRL